MTTISEPVKKCKYKGPVFFACSRPCVSCVRMRVFVLPRSAGFNVRGVFLVCLCVFYFYFYDGQVFDVCGKFFVCLDVSRVFFCVCFFFHERQVFIYVCVFFVCLECFLWVCTTVCFHDRQFLL